MLDVNGTRIAAVILGASQWPKFAGLHPADSFSKSAAAFTAYLKSDNGLGLSTDNILELFDSEDPASTIDKKVRDFLAARVLNADVTDVIVYYSGHGSFTVPDRKYIVMLRSTDRDALDLTSYKIQNLSATLNLSARQTRKWIILDCCSSAAAFGDFQPQDGEIMNVIADEAKKLFPAKGTALLCASSADEVALVPKDGDFTMFSGALVEALTNGSAELDERLSLSQIHSLVLDRIDDAYREKGVRPEVYDPDQRDGGLSQAAFFPNPAKALNVVSRRLGNIERQLRQSEGLVAAAQGQYGQAQGLIANFDKRLGDAEAANAAQKKAVEDIAAQVGELKQSASSFEQYTSQLQLRAINTFGMPEDVWTSTPMDVKRDILVWSQSRTAGRYLLTLTIGLFALSVAIPALVAYSFSAAFERYHSLFTALFPVVILLLLVLASGLLKLFRSRQDDKPAPTDSSPTYLPNPPDERWKDYEPAIRAAEEKPVEILSYKVAREFFLASLLVLTVNACLLIPEARRFFDLLNGRF